MNLLSRCLTPAFALATVAFAQETPSPPPIDTRAVAPAVSENETPTPVAPKAVPAIPRTIPRAAVVPGDDEPAVKVKAVGMPTKPGVPGVAGGPATGGDASHQAIPREVWQMEISYRPGQSIQSVVFGLPSEAPAKPWHFHKLERCVGPLHLEQQELRVTSTPKALGKPLTIDEITSFVRQNFTEFLDPAQASVQPLSFDDRWRLDSKAPTGAVYLFDLKGAKPDKAAMVVSDFGVDRWALTSIYSGKPGYEDHRVAGTRWFGVSNTDGKGPFTIYTKSAVRAIAEPAKEALAADSDLWLGFLTRVKAWVESLGGKAELTERADAIHEADWEILKFTHFSPFEKWKDIDGAWEVKETRDTKKRFRIEIHEGMSGATLFERSPSGKEIKRNTQLSGAGPNSWVLTRPQDEELLAFLDVPTELAKAALGANPPASTLTITRKGENLSATWQGIMIQKNGMGQLDRITTRRREYEMLPSK